MHDPRRLSALALAFFAFAADHVHAQAGRRPELHALRDVRLVDTGDAPHKTLILRNGRVEAILEATASTPDDARTIDMHGAVALPAFVDAYSFVGCEMPKTVAEHDLPPKAGSDLFIDMREANRKGILPAFHAADVFRLDADAQKRWRSSGFGYVLSAPHGQLLSGTSTLCSTREAPPRDAVLVANAFDHGGFDCSGPG